MSEAIDVLIVGAGMFVRDVILPSAYHLQRIGVVGNISVCARRSTSIRTLAADSQVREVFPDQRFTAYPPLDEPDEFCHQELYKSVIADMPPRQAVAICLPDHVHFEVAMWALEHDQHVLCVKPLALKYEHAVRIRETARERGLFVGIEYHKRFDRRSLVARRAYRLGQLGEFVVGEAKMIEPYFYRGSNFQDWFVVEDTDPFTYVGCHYVDLVYFITGLRPVEVSVRGIRGRFPNGNEGFLWANGRVIYENGALLTVTNGLGYPDDGAGSNEQCLTMYFEGDGRTGMIKHDDQFRGVTHCYLDAIGCGGTHHNFVNPDFFQYVPWDGEGHRPTGYGFESVAAILSTIRSIEYETAHLAPGAALVRRRELIAEIDGRGLIATPANSSVNELVAEAARMSILSDGQRIRVSERSRCSGRG